jgi:putative endonuclease
MGHTVYILHSISLNRFYIGATKNITQRLSFHRFGFPHKFTAKAKDWTVFFILECSDKAQAQKIERHIKKMKSSVYIKNLTMHAEMSAKLLSKYG